MSQVQGFTQGTVQLSLGWQEMGHLRWPWKRNSMIELVRWISHNSLNGAANSELLKY